MKPFKPLLMAAVALSAAFQIGYGSTLLANPIFIGTSLGLGDVSANAPLLSVTMLYGKLFITVGLLSGLTIYMLLNEMPLAIMSTLIMAINMLVTGVLGYSMSGKSAYLFADVGRGAVLLALLFGYWRYLRSKCGTRIEAHCHRRSIMVTDC
jgi:hypothetical protein